MNFIQQFNGEENGMLFAIYFYLGFQKYGVKSTKDVEDIYCLPSIPEDTFEN